ncbi:MAG TPA: hypothetical protein VGJ94_03080 [Syntrophorhabdaceae bacterium]|jgi:nucleosome binding factor SPN SPT16 subunit
MNEYGFANCENIFTHKCNGEVTILLHAAERYGMLMEKAKGRIKTICRRCKNFSQQRPYHGSVRDGRELS